MFIFQTADEARMEQIQKVTYAMNIYEKPVNISSDKSSEQHSKFSFKRFWQVVVSH